MGVKIVYKNYALIDKSITFLNGPSQSQDVSEFARLDDLRYSYTPKRLASFEEQYMRSDVGYPFYCMGDDISEVIGYVSNSMCDRAGSFAEENPPSVKIFMDVNNQVLATSDGITLYFSPLEEEYATEVVLCWTVRNPGEPVRKIEETFYPDKNVFFCPKRVENYTAVEVVFKKWSFGNRWARLYRIEYGREVVYEGDTVLSASINESVNFVSDQIGINTSSVVLWADPDETFQEQQYFEIWMDDRLLATHYVKDLKKEGRRISITGYDMVSKLDNSKIKIVGLQLSKFGDWVKRILSNVRDQDLPYIPLDEKNSDAQLLSRYVYCCFDKEMSRREALTAICLAMGAYVDTSEAEGIAIKSTAAALNAPPVDVADPEGAKIIPEVHVFSGDSTEIKESYRSLTVKYKDKDGTEHYTGSFINKAHPDSTAELEVDLTAMHIGGVKDTEEASLEDAAGHLYALEVLYSQYYFHSEFYKAKAVIGENILIGDRVLINGKDAFVIQRTLNLDGDKIIAEGTYKLVKGE